MLHLNLKQSIKIITLTGGMNTIVWQRELGISARDHDLSTKLFYFGLAYLVRLATV
jgi:hypothetical protein